jgi:hypothetical protein
MRIFRCLIRDRNKNRDRDRNYQNK